MLNGNHPAVDTGQYACSDMSITCKLIFFGSIITFYAITDDSLCRSDAGRRTTNRTLQPYRIYD